MFKWLKEFFILRNIKAECRRFGAKFNRIEYPVGAYIVHRNNVMEEKVYCCTTCVLDEFLRKIRSSDIVAVYLMGVNWSSEGPHIRGAVIGYEETL